jgi:hypothetical protein
MLEAEKHSTSVHLKRITVRENNFGLLPFIFNVFLAINISSVIHSDRRIKVADKGSIATISEIIVNEEY